MNTGAERDKKRALVPKSSKRIVLTTFGSLGDLHPFIGIARGLKARGFDAAIATHASYRERVECEDVGFHPIRPDIDNLLGETAAMKQIMNMRTGPEYIIRQIFMPPLRDSYDDLSKAVLGADLLVSHAIAFATPLVAEKQSIPWISTCLAPTSFFSVYDPPVLAPMPALSLLDFLGPTAQRLLFQIFRRLLRSWTEPVRSLRREIGLPESSLDPLFEGQFSPALTIALFSSVLASPQPDWPPNTHVAGFPFYDAGKHASGLAPELSAFLDAGDPPLVFTLGSSAVMNAGNFYTEGVKAARQLGKRAILLIGRDPRNLPQEPLPDGIAVFDYAPYSEVLPRALAVIHQGGIGTTGQALRAGRPMLVVPYGFDQPDNARRVVQLGVARTLPLKSYTASSVVRELGTLLGESQYAVRAAEIGSIIRSEDGVEVACKAIEDHLRVIS